MAKRVVVTEEDAWLEIDKYFQSNRKQANEYDVAFFMSKYGMTRSPTRKRLQELERDGVLTSRMVRGDKSMMRVWKFVKSDSTQSLLNNS